MAAQAEIDRAILRRYEQMHTDPDPNPYETELAERGSELHVYKLLCSNNIYQFDGDTETTPKELGIENLHNLTEVGQQYELMVERTLRESNVDEMYEIANNSQQSASMNEENVQGSNTEDMFNITEDDSYIDMTMNGAGKAVQNVPMVANAITRRNSLIGNDDVNNFQTKQS